MDKRFWFFKQRVQFAEMREADDLTEVADRAIVDDAFAGTGFFMSAVLVVEDSPQSTKVSVPAILGWDKDGKRVFEGATQLFDFTGDDDPVNPRIASLYAKFLRVASNPRVDGAGNTINYDQDEAVILQRDLGTPAGSPTPPTPRTDDSILLANITIPAAAGVIPDANIDTSVQNLQSDFPVERLRGMSKGMDDAMVATVGATPSTSNRVALLSDTALPLGYRGEIKVVTLGALSVDVERADVADGTGAQGIKIRNKLIVLTGGAPALGDKDYPGAIVNADHFIYAVADSNLVTPDDVIVSLNAGPGFGAAGPTLAGLGVDLFRLIGVFLVQAGAILPFRQINGETLYDDTDLSIAFAFGVDPHAGGVPTPFITLSLAPFVGSIAERAIIAVRMETTGGAQNVFYDFRSRGGVALVGKTTSQRVGAATLANEVGSDEEIRLHVDASQDIDWRRDGGGLNHSIEVAVRGFVPDLKYDT